MDLVTGMHFLGIIPSAFYLSRNSNDRGKGGYSRSRIKQSSMNAMSASGEAAVSVKGTLSAQSKNFPARKGSSSAR